MCEFMNGTKNSFVFKKKSMNCFDESKSLEIGVDFFQIRFSMNVGFSEYHFLNLAFKLNGL